MNSYFKIWETPRIVRKSGFHIQLYEKYVLYAQLSMLLGFTKGVSVDVSYL